MGISHGNLWGDYSATVTGDQSMTTQLTQPSDEALVMLEALGRTLEKELDQQARIGQCALVWKDGLPHFIGPDAPPPIEMRKPFK
jgi:hypothetical protein